MRGSGPAALETCSQRLCCLRCAASCMPHCRGQAPPAATGKRCVSERCWSACLFTDLTCSAAAGDMQKLSTLAVSLPLPLPLPMLADCVPDGSSCSHRSLPGTAEGGGAGRRGCCGNHAGCGSSCGESPWQRHPQQRQPEPSPQLPAAGDRGGHRAARAAGSTGMRYWRYWRSRRWWS
jgi:hypothetical protein